MTEKNVWELAGEVYKSSVFQGLYQFWFWFDNQEKIHWVLQSFGNKVIERF